MDLDNKSKLNNAYKIIMLVILTAFITAMITTIAVYKYIGNTNIETTTLSDSEKSLMQRLTYYKSFIQKNYLYDIDEKKMNDEAIKGYFNGLEDQYSEYITKEEMQDYMTNATGKYVGIGVYITKDTEKNQIVIISPMKGSPAEEAGLKPGDIILKVNGVEYNGEQLTDATNDMKGEEGKKILLEILRGENEKFEVEVEARTIKTHHIESKILKNNIGYIEIASFDDGTFEEFKENYNELKQKNIKSLIIDLRNNGGGIVDEATNIADMFTNRNDTLLITAGKNNTEEITKAKTDKEIDMNIVILVNGNTASSSEILTAAIKENNEDKVKIVGETTFGKGVIQCIYTVKDGSGIKLTTNEYYTPKRNKINKEGIHPDVEIKLNSEGNSYIIKEEDDNQLNKAIELLK